MTTQFYVAAIIGDCNILDSFLRTVIMLYVFYSSGQYLVLCFTVIRYVPEMSNGFNILVYHFKLVLIIFLDIWG